MSIEITSVARIYNIHRTMIPAFNTYALDHAKRFDVTNDDGIIQVPERYAPTLATQFIDHMDARIREHVLDTEDFLCTTSPASSNWDARSAIVEFLISRDAIQ